MEDLGQKRERITARKSWPEIIGIVLLLGGLLTVGPAWGQVPWAVAARAAKRLQYDRGSEVTVTGTVTEVEQLPPRRFERLSRVHLELKTDRETVIVQLGPQSWLEQHNFHLAPGDQLKIKGSRITHPLRTFIIAAQVQKNGQVLQLRDETGRSLWGRSGAQP